MRSVITTKLLLALFGKEQLLEWAEQGLTPVLKEEKPNVPVVCDCCDGVSHNGRELIFELKEGK